MAIGEREKEAATICGGSGRADLHRAASPSCRRQQTTLIAALVFAIRENLSCRAILFSIGILGFESWGQGRLSEWGFRGKSASSVGAVLWNFTWERNILSLSSAQTAFIQVVQRLIH